MQHNPRMIYRSFLRVAACTLFGGAGCPTWAAQHAEPNAVLAEVVVSITRRPVPRLDYAGSIDRLDAPQLALVGAQHYADALNRVPGVYIQRGSGQEGLIAIRSPVLTGAGSCGAFLVLEDSLPIRPTGFCNVNELLELNTDQASAIEVLRGAGPALYGANAVHGIINVITPDALDYQPATISLDSGANRFKRLRFSTAATENLALYGNVTQDAGWRAHSASNEAKLNVLSDHQLDRGTLLGGGTLRLTASGTLLNQQTAGLLVGRDAYRNLTLIRSNANPEAFRDAWSARLAAQWQRDSTHGGLDQLSLMLRDSQMQFLQHFLPGEPLERNGQISALLSASHRSADRGLWRWGTGADLEWADGSLLETQAGPTLQGSAAARAIRPTGRHYDYAVRALSLGLWLDGERQLTKRLAVGGGLRGDGTHYRYDNRMRDGNTDESGVPCASGGCLYSRPAGRSDQFHNVAPKLHLRFAANGEQSIYAVLARGFRPPEATELYRLQRQQAIASLQAEVLDSAELGWLGNYRALHWTLAAFTMRKRHVILRDSSGFNISDGRTRHQGLEYLLDWQMSPLWRLTLSGSQTRHRYDFSLVIDGGDTITAGYDVRTAPRQLQSLRLDFQWRPGLHGELEVLRVGRYFADAANLTPYPGHAVANMRFLWQVARLWQLSLRLDNLSDARYADRADFAQGDYRYIPGRPRSAFVQLQWQNN